VRYLACVISRFRDLGATAAPGGNGSGGESINVLANSRQVARARSTSLRAAEIFDYYASVLNDVPYPGFTVAFTERELPGGHSPAYFAVVDQPQRGPASWRSDPVNFDNYPAFFLAHEIAHQWWGQAIGWKNYHEQWLSEGFSQYFAALYAENRLSLDVMEDVLKQMRQTAIRQSSQGPVYLGYRLGHIRGDSRVFRSVIYNKAAMVLHMLRRLVGDEAFFAGIRSFYAEFKYKKAGTDDLMKAMQQASGRDLSAFFETWIFGSTIPTASFSYRVDGGRVILRLEQIGPPVEFPVGIRLTFASGRTDTIILRARDQVTEQSVPLPEPLRAVRANADHGSLVEIR
jgi:Peptidase family M1 domain